MCMCVPLAGLQVLTINSESNTAIWQSSKPMPALQCCAGLWLASGGWPSAHVLQASVLDAHNAEPALPHWGAATAISQTQVLTVHVHAGLREAHLLSPASAHCWPEGAAADPLDSLSQPSPGAHGQSSFREAAVRVGGTETRLLPAPPAVEAVLDLALSSLPGLHHYMCTCVEKEQIPPLLGVSMYAIAVNPP